MIRGAEKLRNLQESDYSELSEIQEELRGLPWALQILHDPKYLILWELWHYSILRSGRIFSINSTGDSGLIVANILDS